jgi:DNA-binding NarL/FixJ family response regulator
MTDLLDGISLSELRGRKQKSVAGTFVRPLQEADLQVLKNSGERGIKPSPLKRLSERHHAIARLVATGQNNGYISAVTGMEPTGCRPTSSSGRPS